MLPSHSKAACSRLCEPPARLLVRLGLSPSAITLLGLLLVIASCVWVLATRQLLLFCVLVTAAGLFDVLDGAAARLSGRVTKFGAYLDAVCDRYAEAAVVLSVAIVTGYWTLSVIVLAGAMLVSYTKARAAMEAPISNLEWPDLMERAERSAVYIAGLAAGQVMPVRLLGRDLFWWTLALLSVLIHATVLQRILRARRLIASRGERV
ncbi:MAG: CDP-alcohol phosphatidyltransferase family protein [Candidatus Omnitrophica bacterium]|nr:CDP-alcohol phosphatidyltransferase family protein [Candidatus Omnitrophota bacterium]